MRRRKAFTITELLVAMALIVFIMYILAEAFSAASTAFRNLKAIGDMNEKLRTASNTLRRYLQADHFEDKKRLSDADFWKNGPPQSGFFRVYHGSCVAPLPTAPGYEGVDLEGNPSYRAVDQGLHFAVKLRGNSRNDYFRASLPNNSPLLQLPFQDARFQDPAEPTYCSPWAEVAVFMEDSGDVAEDPADPSLSGPGNAQPLYTLYLRQRLCVPDNDVVATKLATLGLPANTMSPLNFPQYAEMSCHVDPADPVPTKLYFNGPGDLTMPARRLGFVTGGVSPVYGPLVPAPPGPFSPLSPRFFKYSKMLDDNATLAGNDVLLTNVLSFEIRLLPNRQQWESYRQRYQNSLPRNLPYDFLPLHDQFFQEFAVAPGLVAQNKKIYPRNPNYPVTGPPFIPDPKVVPIPNDPTYTTPMVFDTWSSARDSVFDYSGWEQEYTPTSIPMYQNRWGDKIRIMAIQISIRIYDINTRQSRQTSVIVEM